MSNKFKFRTVKAVADASLDSDVVTVEQPPVEYKINSEAQLIINDADDIALFLIGSGVSSEELATFYKVKSLLVKAKHTKEVTPVNVREWTKTMSEFSGQNIPSTVALDEYQSRTTVRKSVVNAFAALLHLNKSNQGYLSTSEFQQDRNDVPVGFHGHFKKYDETTIDDAKTSRDILLKATKSGCDNYNQAGGVLAVVDSKLDDPSIVERIVSVGEASQKDNTNLVSRISDPFNFVGQNIDVPKAQSYEHGATKILQKLLPTSLFYCVDDKMSAHDLLNSHLKDKPDDYAVYIKMKPTGVVGDIYTNKSIFDHLGHSYGFNEVDVGDQDRKLTYDEQRLDLGDIDQVVDLISQGEFAVSDDDIRIGKYVFNTFIPARLSRLASVDDLNKYFTCIQLITLPVLSGALNKSQSIFEKYRFYVFDPMGHVCLAVPGGYLSDLPIVKSCSLNLENALDIGVAPVTTNNVKPYMATCSEMNSYLFLLLSCFYANVRIDRNLLFSTINTVLEAVVPINPIPFQRMTAILFAGMMEKYAYLVGSEKIDDRRVMAFVDNALLDKLTPVVERKKKVDEDVSRRIGARRFNFGLNNKPDAPPPDKDGGIDKEEQKNSPVGTQQFTAESISSMSVQDMEKSLGLF